jgi:hypothetical protein
MSDTPESSAESTTAGGAPGAGASTHDGVRNGRRSRLNQAAAWVGIVAGTVFIVAVIFFSGFFLGWPGGHHGNSGDCCAHMGAGKMMNAEHMMGPGQMGPGQMPPGQMGPGQTAPGQMGPGTKMPGGTMSGGMMGPREMGPGGMMARIPMGPGNSATSAVPNMPRA